MSQAYEDFLLLLHAQEKTVAAQFREIVRKAASTTSYADLVAAITNRDFAAIMRLLQLDEAAMQPLAVAIRNVFEAGGIHQAASIRVPKSLRNKHGMSVAFNGRHRRAEDIARRLGSEMVSSVSQGTRDGIQEIIMQGIEQGRHPRLLARDILGTTNRANGQRGGVMLGLTPRQVEAVNRARQDLQEASSNLSSLNRYLSRKLRDRRYDSLVRRAYKERRDIPAAEIDRIVRRYSERQLQARAESIARTETLSALNAGRDEGREQIVENLGLGFDPSTKRWQSTPGKRTRDTHRATNGKTVRANEPFYINGSLLRFPGDRELGAARAETINCRCTIVTEIDWGAVARAAE